MAGVAAERAIALKMGIGKDRVPDKQVFAAALKRGNQEVSLRVKLDLTTVHLVQLIITWIFMTKLKAGKSARSA